MGAGDSGRGVALSRILCNNRVPFSEKVSSPNREMVAHAMDCNGRHHSIGFGNGAGGLKRLGHIMLEVNDMDDVGSTYDICLKRGIESTTLGRHPNDRMISFYMASPSRWQFQ